MTFLLPLVALALAFAAPLVLRTERGKIEPLRAAALLALLVAAAVVVFRAAPEADRTPALVGLVLGGLACLVGSWAGGMAVGVAAAGALHLLPAAALPTAGLALVAGTGLGALAVGGELAAVAAVLVVAADNLGMRHSQVPAAAFVGSQVGVAAAVGAFLAAAFVSGLLPKGAAFLRPVVAGALVLLAGLYVAKTLNESGLNLCVGLGALAGILVHFMMPDEEADASRVGLAAVIGVGLATVAFGLGKGAGMALAALAAGGVLLAVENRRALLALGPFVGLVMYRVLREAGTGATRALDIGQHYTLLALVLGLTLPLLPFEGLRLRGGAARAALWGVVMVAAAPLVVVALGMRGGIGFVVGLGVAGLVQAMRGEPLSPPGDRGDGSEPRTTSHDPRPTLAPLALGSGLAGATILALGWLGDEASITRDQKVRLLAYAAAGIAVVAVLLLALGRQTKKETAS